MSAGHAGLLLGCFVAAFGTLCLGVAQLYPDKPSAPRTFPGGLDVELGGPNTVLVSTCSSMRGASLVTLYTKARSREDEA